MFNTHDIYWVGVRLSDLIGIENLFKGAIVLQGAKINQPNLQGFYLKSFEKERHRRINFNNPNNHESISSFYKNEIQERIQADKNAYFLWYNNSNIRNAQIRDRSICVNSFHLTRLLNDKHKCRSFFSRILKVIPSVIVFGEECKFESLKSVFPDSNAFVIQQFFSAGGLGTFILDENQDRGNLFFQKDFPFVASVYLENALPVNNHIVVYENDLVIMPPSLQLIERIDNQPVYLGCDFGAFQTLGANVANRIYNNALIVGKKLQKLGYLGVAGIDFLIDKKKNIFFVEINPRFQASTFVLNKSLLANLGVSVQELHVEAFEQSTASISEINCKADDSCYVTSFDPQIEFESMNLKAHLSHTNPEVRKTKFNTGSLELKILSDGISKNYTIDTGASIARSLYSSTISTIGFNNAVQISPAIRQFNRHINGKFNSLSGRTYDLIAKLKFELFTFGMKISPEATKQLLHKNLFLTIGDGIAGGLNIVLFDKFFIDVPVKEGFVVLSPYTLDIIENRYYVLKHLDKTICKVTVISPLGLIGKTTGRGKKYETVAQVFTDRLRISVFCGCKYNAANNKACKFCKNGYQDKHEYNNIKDIEEVLKHFESQDPASIKHILVTGGSIQENEFSKFMSMLERIRSMTRKKIYLMTEPPAQKAQIDRMVEIVDEIGFNIELYNRKIAKKLMPGKGRISLQHYLDSLVYAASKYHSATAVRSILIVGLEPIEDTIQGVKQLVSAGILPILSPFRPIPSTPLSNYPQPGHEVLYEVWNKAQEICEKEGTTLGPLCICCLNNTISIPLNDKYIWY